MNLALASGATLALLIACAFVLLFRKMRLRQHDMRSLLEWSRDFSVAKYRPMQRLLDEDDYEFLEGQPGYQPGISKRLQAERRRIFRQYLSSITRDFDRLYVVAKFILLHSPQDRPDLAAALMKQRAIFRYAVAAVYCRLALQALGIGTVDVRGLVDALDNMRLQLHQLSRGLQVAGAAA